MLGVFSFYRYDFEIALAIFPEFDFSWHFQVEAAVLGYDDFFAPFPVFPTARMTLRAMRPRDLGDVYALCSHPKVAEYVLWDAHQTKQDTRRYLNWVIDGYRQKKPPIWAMELNQTHRVIGTCTFVEFDPAYKVAEMGYIVSYDCWGQGYATEAAAALVTYGFSRMRLQRIESRCMAENKRSARVMQKLGMRFEGILRKGVFSKGVPHDLYLYAMTDDDYRRIMDTVRRVDLEG